MFDFKQLLVDSGIIVQCIQCNPCIGLALGFQTLVIDVNVCNCVTRQIMVDTMCIVHFSGEQAAETLPGTALTTWLRCWSWPRCHWLHHKVRFGLYDAQKDPTTSSKSNDRNYHHVRSDIGPAREATDVSDDRHAPPPGLNFLDKRFC